MSFRDIDWQGTAKIVLKGTAFIAGIIAIYAFVDFHGASRSLDFLILGLIALCVLIGFEAASLWGIVDDHSRFLEIWSPSQENHELKALHTALQKTSQMDFHIGHLHPDTTQRKLKHTLKMLRRFTWFAFTLVVYAVCLMIVSVK